SSTSPTVIRRLKNGTSAPSRHLTTSRPSPFTPPAPVRNSLNPPLTLPLRNNPSIRSRKIISCPSPSSPPPPQPLTPYKTLTSHPLISCCCCCCSSPIKLNILTSGLIPTPPATNTT